MPDINSTSGGVNTSSYDTTVYDDQNVTDEVSARGRLEQGDEIAGSDGTKDTSFNPAGTPKLKAPGDEAFAAASQEAPPEYTEVPHHDSQFMKEMMEEFAEKAGVKEGETPTEEQAAQIRQYKFAHSFPEEITDESLLEFIESSRDKSLAELKEQNPDLPGDFEAPSFFTKEQLEQMSDNTLQNHLDDLPPDSKINKDRVLGAFYTKNQDNLTTEEKDFLANVGEATSGNLEKMYGAPKGFQAVNNTAFNEQLAADYSAGYERLLQESGLSPEDMQNAEFFHYHPETMTAEFAHLVTINADIQAQLSAEIAGKYGISGDHVPPEGFNQVYDAILSGKLTQAFDQALNNYALENQLSQAEIDAIKNAFINPTGAHDPKVLEIKGNIEKIALEAIGLPVSFNPLATTSGTMMLNSILANPAFQRVMGQISESQNLINQAYDVVNAMPDSEEKQAYLDFLKVVSEALSALTEFLFIMMGSDSSLAKEMTQAELGMKLEKLDEQKRKMLKMRKKRKKAKRMGKIMKAVTIAVTVIMVAVAVALAAPFGPVAMALAGAIAVTLAADTIGKFGIANSVMGGSAQMGKFAVKAFFAAHPYGLILKETGAVSNKDIKAMQKIGKAAAQIATLAALAYAVPGAGVTLALGVAFTKGPGEKIIRTALDAIASTMGWEWANSEWAVLICCTIAMLAIGGAGASKTASKTREISKAMDKMDDTAKALDKTDDAAKTATTATKAKAFTRLKEWVKADISRIRQTGEQANRAKNMRYLKAQKDFLGKSTAKTMYRLSLFVDSVEVSASATQDIVAIQMAMIRADIALEQGDLEAFLEEMEMMIKIVRTAIDSFLNAISGGEGSATQWAANTSDLLSNILGGLSKMTSQITAATHG